MYKEQCEEKNLSIHHYTVPLEIKKAQEQAEQVKGKQKKLDRIFVKAGRVVGFSREHLLKAVACFVVGNNQVRVVWNREGDVGFDAVLQSLIMANKTLFRNCLVAMCPSSTSANLPSKHDVCTYIHNEFIDFFNDIKARINVSDKISMKSTYHIVLQAGTARRISTTTDLWSVKQTKAAFMGITAHWIECHTTTGLWSLCSKIIAFRGIAGTHTGENLGWYFVKLCEHAGIITQHHMKVCAFHV